MSNSHIFNAIAQIFVMLAQQSDEKETGALRDGMNVVEFLNDPDWITFDPRLRVSSADLYEKYYEWAIANAFQPMKKDTVIGWIKQRADELGGKYTAGIKDDKRKVRGFIGVGFTVRG